MEDSHLLLGYPLMNQALQSSCPQEEAHGGAWPPTNRAAGQRPGLSKRPRATWGRVCLWLEPMAGELASSEVGLRSGPSTGAALMDPGGRHGLVSGPLLQQGWGVESAFYLPPTQHWAGMNNTSDSNFISFPRETSCSW